MPLKITSMALALATLFSLNAFAGVTTEYCVGPRGHCDDFKTICKANNGALGGGPTATGADEMYTCVYLY